MRTREEIANDYQPKLDSQIVELLLDIRDLLKPEITGGAFTQEQRDFLERNKGTGAIYTMGCKYCSDTNCDGIRHVHVARPQGDE